jgi:hypothetical protein
MGGCHAFDPTLFHVRDTFPHFHVEDEHIKNLRTKSQRGSLPKLVSAGNTMKDVEGTGCAVKEHSSNNNKQTGMLPSPREVLFAYIKELVATAGKTGDVNISARDN